MRKVSLRHFHMKLLALRIACAFWYKIADSAYSRLCAI